MTGVPGDPLSLVGKTLAGHFLVQSLAAEGNTSFVYRGEHVGPKRPVALKCLKISVELDAARSDTFLKRFREESRAYSQASRNEPHYVRSIGTGMTATGSGAYVPYSVLEWLEGRTLATDCKERTASHTNPRTLAETAELLAPTARALASVHAQNLSHGDISSRNIYLLKNPMSGFDTKLLDFGVSKVVRDVSRELETSGKAPTDDDRFWIPSPGYAAPEQLRRELGDVGPWSDVYSFAVVFLETMCGRSLGTPPPLVTQLGLILPETVERVLARALMESPKDRWPRAGEFWAALEDSLRVSAIQIPTRPQPASPPGAQTVRLGNPVAPAAPVPQAVSSTSSGSSTSTTTVTPGTPAGKQTIRLGGNSPAARLANKPALLPAAATRQPPAAGAKPVAAPPAPPPPAPTPSPGAVTMPMTPPPFATPDPPGHEQKPIAGAPVIFAKTPTNPPPRPQSPALTLPATLANRPVRSPDGRALDTVRMGASSPSAAPMPSAGDAGRISPSSPISIEPVSSGPVSAPPAPPPRGAILEVAPGPLPAPPPPSSTGNPASENARSVSAAPPAARAQVSMESLPSVIVADAEKSSEKKPSGSSSGSGSETVRLYHPPPNTPPSMHGNAAPGFVSGPPSAMHSAPPGLPPSSVQASVQASVHARPGVLVMPPNMAHATPPSNHRVSYDGRRERERKRLFVVMFVSFAVVFLVGAGVLALHFLRGRTATSMSAHSASN